MALCAVLSLVLTSAATAEVGSRNTPGSSTWSSFNQKDSLPQLFMRYGGVMIPRIPDQVRNVFLEEKSHEITAKTLTSSFSQDLMSTSCLCVR
jgi:hypothetical protein